MNFERHKNPKSALNIGIFNSRTVETLIFMYREILKEFKGKPHPLKKETTESFSSMIPRRFSLNAGWGNMNNIFYDLDDSEFNHIFDLMYNHFCQIVQK